MKIPLASPPKAQAAIQQNAAAAFRYPRSGNPRLVKALATLYHLSTENLVIGNGSDEIIDLLIRITADPAKDNLVCCAPCFNLYPIQAQISGIRVKKVPLNPDFSFNFEGLLSAVDAKTRLLFLTTPDNPSGYCPPLEDVRALAQALAKKAPECLLLLDEAYMDFADHEQESSLLLQEERPANVAIMRTFSKSFGLAGLRLGYAYLPKELAEAFWRARLPFSVNILAEEAGLAALQDQLFREQTMQVVREGRLTLHTGLTELGAKVYQSQANFLLFTLPPSLGSAKDCFNYLLQKGIIIRLLNSYDLPDHLRVTVGDPKENQTFLNCMREFCAKGQG